MKKKKSKQPPADRRSGNRRRNRFLPMAIGTTGGVVIASAAFFFFARQAEHVVAGRAEEFDEDVMSLVHRANGAVTTNTMRLITEFGSHTLCGGAAAICAIRIARHGKTRDAWTIILNTAGAMALNTALKAIFQRQRPEVSRHIRLPRSHSFPSGHSLLSAATYPIVVHHFLQEKSTRTIILGQSAAGTLILLVGLSRVYFGVHFPSDVLGGFAAGFGWLGLTSLTHSMIERDVARGRRSSDRRELLAVDAPPAPRSPRRPRKPRVKPT